MTIRTTGAAAAGLLALLVGGGAAAQGSPVDRGTADLGPNTASQRVVEPGIAQFSPEAALVDRFADSPFAVSRYVDPRAQRRYLYRAPGVTALYNQSTYFTQDHMGVPGINLTNAGHGRAVPLVSPDTVYVLSPDLLEGQRPTPLPLDPLPGMVDRRVQPTPIAGSPTNVGPTGQVVNTVDGRVDPSQPRMVDIEAIHAQQRGAQRDPRLVERARVWREQREREAREAQEAAAEASEAQDAPDEPTPEPAADDG